MTNARLEELRSKFQENPRRYFAPFANELRKAGDPAQAIQVCRTHLATQPGHVSGHIVLGQALYEAGETQEARDIFTASLDLDPENLIALRTLGEISQVNGEFLAARQWYERLLEADPRNGEVSQLLKDLPTENAKAALPSEPVQAHAAETSLEEHKDQERSAFEPPVVVPSSSFHSGFTGPGPAYKTAEDLEEEAQAQARAEVAPAEVPAPAAAEQPVEYVEMDAIEQVAAAAPEPEWQPASESIEMVDLDAFTAEQSASEVTPAAPDASRIDAATTSDEGMDFSFSEPEPVASQPEPVPTAELQHPVEDATEEFEQPRALFAEHGFDGPAGDQIGWMMTPSAVESDLESAPEDWFDAPVADQMQETNSAEPDHEPQVVEASAPSPSTDSWFDEVQGASVVAPTEGITTDEFWLPPDLSQVRTTPAAAAPEPEPEPFAVEASQPETVEALPVSESTFELPVAQPSEREELATMETVSAMESSPAEPEPYESRSSIEYFNHDEPAAADVHEEAPVAEWEQPAVTDYQEVESSGWIAPFEQAPEPEPYVQPVAEPQQDAVNAWEPSAADVQEAQDEVVGETQPVEEPAASPEPEPLIVASALPDEPAVAEPAVGHTPLMAEAEMQSPPAPFVTETLAELYLQQGFREEALSIYRQLVEREPSNAALRDRMEAIERGEGERKQAMPQIAASDRAASQSVRTFFSKLARRQAAGPSPMGAPSEEGVSQPDVPFAQAASALASMFAAAKPPASDENAAATLAGAYTNPTGRPSRAADRELSLDHLFRDVPPGGSQAGGMSLDEFYSTPNAESDSPTESGEASESPDAGGADIRQFTAWLEGLRKK